MNEFVAAKGMFPLPPRYPEESVDLRAKPPECHHRPPTRQAAPATRASRRFCQPVAGPSSATRASADESGRRRTGIPGYPGLPAHPGIHDSCTATPKIQMMKENLVS